MVAEKRSNWLSAPTFTFFNLLLLAAWSSPVAGAESITAIDVLLLPDQTMVDHADATNARMRENYPAGFALDAAHRPHISLLQRYVRTKDLEAVYGAVGKVLNEERPAGWELEATGYFYVIFNEMGLPGIVVRPTPALLRLQQEMIDAVGPYTVADGTSGAFVTKPDSPNVNASTMEYVKSFVPKQRGKNYNPHVTVGVGQVDFVERMKSAPFASFKFKVAGAAVFHLGNYGTAAKELWKWKPTDTTPVVPASFKSAKDPLPSWNDGPTKQAILSFVEKVTTEGSSDFVSPHERIATFDNDGTLWCEMPIYTQCAFAIDRVKALAPEHPEWKEKQPFKAVLEHDREALIASGERGLVEIVLAGHTGISTTDFEQIVRDWISTARHPRFQRPYTQLAYQPMLELLAYLRSQGFKTYIVSGGGIEFMRPWTMRVYGVPPEQVVGTTVKTEYEVQNGEPVLMRLPDVDFIDDKQGKAIGINRFIGRRPIMAFGNSDGDYEMLRWTTAGAGARFGLIVHHTDAEREYAYDRDSIVGRLDRALDEAPKRGWVVVDMKNDWRTIFAEN